jgi:hypothetical protein
MHPRFKSRSKSVSAAVLGALSAAALVAGCSTAAPQSPGSPPPTPSSAPNDGMNGMGGMPMASGDGLADTVNGYTLTLRTPPATTAPASATFTITHDGNTVTQFDPEQTKLMHFYLIRSDLTGFQHVHPAMSPDGTWTAPTKAVPAGDYRVYVQFVPRADAAAGALTVSTPITVPGSDASAAARLPAPGATATVDGYTIALSGALTAGQEAPLTITISRSGQPVTDLQPYLDTYAHVTAIHQGDLAFAHLHPEGTVSRDHGGPALNLHAQLPAPGNYRMFIQFQTNNTLHTASITVTAS